MLLTSLVVHVPAQVEIDADLNEYETLSTKTRAAFGRAAVEAGAPDHDANDDIENAVDTIAHVLHWLHQQGDMSPDEVVAVLTTATMHFGAEVDA
jgi:hypothetical protein